MPKFIHTFLVLFTSQFLHADYFTEYIKYDPQHEFSRIVITNETIRGHRGVDYFKDNSKEYEKKMMSRVNYLANEEKKFMKKIEKTRDEAVRMQ